MTNIIKAEIYKFRKSKDMLLCLLFVGVMCYIDYKFTTGSFSSQLLSSTTTVPFLMIFILTNWAHEPMKDKTLKNYFTVGNKKSEVYFGRLISSIIIAFFVFVMLLLSSIVISLVQQLSINFVHGEVLFSLLIQLVVILIYSIIYFGLASIVQNTLLSFLLCFVIAYFDNFIFSGLGKYLHISTLTDYSLSNAADTAQKMQYTGDLWIALVVGLAVGVLLNLLGFTILKKKTI